MCEAGDPRRRSSCRRSDSVMHGSVAGRRSGSSPKRRRPACGGRWRRTSGSRSTWGCGTGIPTSAMRSSTSWPTDTGGRWGSCSRRTTRRCPWARTRRSCSRRPQGGSTRRWYGAGATTPSSSRRSPGGSRKRCSGSRRRTRCTSCSPRTACPSGSSRPAIVIPTSCGRAPRRLPSAPGSPRGASPTRAREPHPSRGSGPRRARS